MLLNVGGVCSEFGNQQGAHIMWRHVLPGNRGISTFFCVKKQNIMAFMSMRKGVYITVLGNIELIISIDVTMIAHIVS